ncbi:hypothetical protein X274_11505 [Marinitoga sp. 1155]|nr:hypothetical protein X274_11505 [Marinitoga sp. 1155]
MKFKKTKSYYEGFNEMVNLEKVLLEMKRYQF